MSFSSIVVAGGSLRVISFLGCLKFLEEGDKLGLVRNCVGTSAGALLCLGISLRFTCDEMRSFLVRHLCGNTGGIGDFGAEDIFNLFSQYGLDQGNKLIVFIEAMLLEKTGRRDMTFIELAKLNGMNLVVCVTNLTRERHEFFCVDTTPHLSVVTALRVTCSIPFLFTPVTINGDVYLDGALLNNFPLDYFEGDRLHDVLGFNIRNTHYQKTGNFMQYFCFVVNCMLEKFGSQVLLNCPTKNIVTIEFPGDTAMSIFDLKGSMSESTVDAYIENGYQAILDAVVRKPFLDADKPTRQDAGQDGDRPQGDATPVQHPRTAPLDQRAQGEEDPVL